MVKMRKLPSLKAWAAQNKVDIHVVNAYQKARRNWMNRVSEYARKTGGIKSKEIDADIRLLKPLYGQDFEQYIMYRESVIRARSAHATEYLDNRQDTYLRNILTRMSESPSLENDNIVSSFNQWLSSASRLEKSALIKELGGATLSPLGYEAVEVTDKRGRRKKEVQVIIDYDFSEVIQAFNTIVRK